MISELPLVLIEKIGAQLCLADRVSVTSCCRGLWGREDVVASSALWGDVGVICPGGTQQDQSATSMQQTPPHSAAHSEKLTHLRLPADNSSDTLRSLLQWLRRHSRGLRSIVCEACPLHTVTLHLLDALQYSPVQRLYLRRDPELGIALTASPTSGLQQLGTLPQLTLLSLSGCHLGALPTSVLSLPRLRHLDLSDTHQGGGFREAEVHKLTQLSLLTHLALGGSGVGTFPCTLSSLSALRELRLGQNVSLGLFAVAEGLQALHGMRGLTLLDLRGTNLQALPRHLSAAVNLRDLDVGNNQLGCSGRDIGWTVLACLGGLTRLGLRNNMLAALPQELSELTVLACLEASGNVTLGNPADVDLAFAPLRHCSALTSLLLLGCRLPSLPSHLSALHRLRRLGVADNRLGLEVEGDPDAVWDWFGEREPDMRDTIHVLGALPCLEQVIISRQEDQGLRRHLLDRGVMVEYLELLQSIAADAQSG